MTYMQPMPATTESFSLGEGPVWDGVRDRLLWVDIEAGAVLEGRLDGDRIEVTGRTEFGCLVGAVAVSLDGRMLVAAQERLVMVDLDGTRVDGPRIVPVGEPRRLNDGKTDPAGNFLVGTMSLKPPSHRECLVRLERDWAVTGIDDDLGLSNGLAWPADGGRLFSVDSAARTVWVRDYDAVTGTVGRRRPFLRLGEGHPDGICMDADDHLWMAVWGSGEIRRIAPDGSVVGRIRVPAPHTSSVAFAGDDLDLLVITTAISELTDEQLRRYPESGRVFTVRVDVPGLPVTPWNGPGRLR